MTWVTKTKISMKTRVFALLLGLLIVFAAVSCTKPSTPDGKSAEVISNGSATYYSVSAVDYSIEEMHYKVLISADGDVEVINVTKDSLEVLNLRR